MEPIRADGSGMDEREMDERFGEGMRQAKGRISAFGFDSTEASAEVIPRSSGWRMTRALLALAIGLGVAPVVFILPPHVPWALAAVASGAYFARRFATERRTLVRLEGRCPRCGSQIRVEKQTVLKDPHPLSCSGCGNDVLLEVSAGG